MSTPAAALPNPVTALRSRRYVVLLVLTAVLGVPISAAAWGFLQGVAKLQPRAYTDLPKALGFAGTPSWWPLVLLGVAGLLVAPCIRYLPGAAGHSPADGFSAGMTEPIAVPGVLAAAFIGLVLGVVLGPEAPLIAMGGGAALFVVRLSRREVPPTSQMVVASAGSFAAVSALFGSPIIAAFLMMEIIGLGGATLELVLIPGLLAAGVGSLVFVGLGRWSGLGTQSLVIPALPHFSHPTGPEVGWAVAMGVAAALAGFAIRFIALRLRERVRPRILWATPIVGLAIGGLAIAFAEITHKPATEVLYSGQSAVGPLIVTASAWSISALVLLMLCKGLAYALALSSFRGGPVFPSLLLGAAGGLAAAHLPGMELSTVAGVAMGIGAMAVAMLRLPMTSVLLPALMLGSAGQNEVPLAIIAVVVAYVVGARLPDLTAPRAGASLPDGASEPAARS
jgi:H+/Cl- antiporter ClcA